MCGDREVYTPDRKSCIECQPYSKAGLDNTVCLKAKCEANEIIAFNGQCLSCESHQEPDPQGKTCIHKGCDGEREKYSIDRQRCIQCEPFTRAQNSNTNCEADRCAQN